MIITEEIFLQSEKAFLSKIYIDGKFYAYNLGDPLREKKIPKITGFPLGKYAVVLTFSPKYSSKYGGKAIPEIMVQGYSGIRIHAGNKPEDTDACILPGANAKPTEPFMVMQTTAKAKELNEMIMAAIDGGDHVDWIRKMQDGVNPIYY